MPEEPEVEPPQTAPESRCHDQKTVEEGCEPNEARSHRTPFRDETRRGLHEEPQKAILHPASGRVRTSTEIANLCGFRSPVLGADASRSRSWRVLRWAISSRDADFSQRWAPLGSR